MASKFRDCLNDIYLVIIQRNLKCIAAALFVISLSLIIAIIVISHNNSEIAEELIEDKQKICLTHGCINKASSILNNMDASVNPCDDFYKFACGGFLKKTFIPDDQAAVTSLTAIKNLVYQQIKSILEEPTNPDEMKPFDLTKKFYNSCVNTTAIEADGLTTIKEILDSLGGWPILEGTNWYDAKFDWKQAMYTLRNIGYEANYFLSVKIITNLKNSSQRVINIDEAALELPRDIILGGLDHHIVTLYYDYMMDVAEHFGYNRSVINDELTEILDLQIELANISLSSDKRENETLLYNPMTIGKLEKVYPNTNWKEYIKHLLDIPEFQISNNEVIIVAVPQYLQDLEELLDRTPKRIQANYIMWRLVSSSMRYLTRDLRERKLAFNKALTGARQPLPRWKDCIYQTLRRFWKPVRTLHDHKHFSKKSKGIAKEISASIQSEFLEILEDATWMDEESRVKAFEKASSVKMHGSNFEIESDEELTEYYSKLEFSSDNYLRAVLAVSLFNSNRYFMNLRKPVEKNERDRDISLEYNIYVPGGIFQEPFFNSDQPYYVNYGGIGILMGHLLSHEFDNEGRQLNKHNDLANWWTDYTENAFNEQAECFVKHYENYTNSKLSFKVNGNTTRDEIIADSGGMKSAYLAYNAWVESNGPEPQLPGLNYTAQQMFWISAADVFCSKLRKEQLHYYLLISRSATHDYTIIGTLENSEYFGKDFNCSLGSKMNPENKCKIW